MNSVAPFLGVSLRAPGNCDNKELMISVGLLARLQSRDETKEELQAFLTSALAAARAEDGTIAWFAFHFRGNEFGIFDVFEGETGRQAHLNGSIAKALMAQSSRLLAKPPQIERLDVIASKLPQTPVPVVDTRALLLTFQAKTEHEDRMYNFLREAQPWVEAEPDTTAWFAIHLEDGKFGIFDTFPDHAGRLKHLTGRVARELATHALSLLGGLPDPELPDILAEKL